MKKPSKTASELMSELHGDPAFVRAQQRRDSARKQAALLTSNAIAPIISELNRIGVELTSLSELSKDQATYRQAIPILTKWLPQISEVHAKEIVVRCLSVPFAKGAGPTLICEFKTAPPDSSLKWAIGNAIAVVATDALYIDVVDLVTNRLHAKAREMLAVALGNIGGTRATDVLVKMLDDDVIAGHAILGLAKLRCIGTAIPTLRRFLDHPTPWIRKEAKKAIDRYMKRARGAGSA